MGREEGGKVGGEKGKKEKKEKRKDGVQKMSKETRKKWNMVSIMQR